MSYNYYFIGGIISFFLLLFLVFFYYRVKWNKEIHQALMINSKLKQSETNGYKYKYRVA
jgi:hypothetical protein